MRTAGYVGYLVLSACLVAGMGLALVAEASPEDGPAIGMLCVLPVGLAGLVGLVAAVVGTIACWRERPIRLLAAIAVGEILLFAIPDVPAVREHAPDAVVIPVAAAGMVASIAIGWRALRARPVVP